ncbi:MAG: ABC transporter ATP-binding protein [Clostridia bacterium]|nr:ABC transporter ATP-binding protein [Clostridia bacterium]
MDNILEIKDLNVVYETDEATFYAINGLNLTMQRGEMIGLVGETGAGKTTTALSVMRLLPDRIGKIVSGSIRLNGVEITKATKHDMQIMRGEIVSMIFQDPMTSLNPLIPIGKQIEEALILHKKDMPSQERKQQVDRLLTMIGLSPDRKMEYPHQFSGGMKQRIVIAMALACEPLLLLADEPTTALDVTIQAQVLDMMKRLKEEFNTAVILITHDLGIVAQTCSRVAIMYAGEIIEIGSVEAIFTPGVHHPYTTGLFGSIPDIKSTTRRLNPINGLMPDPSILFTGCRFAERCPHAMPKCNNQRPTVYEKDGHSVLCHLYGQKKATTMQEDEK